MEHSPATSDDTLNLMKSPRLYDAQNREAAYLALDDPEKYPCLQEWARMVIERAPARKRVSDSTLPPASSIPRRVLHQQPELDF